MAYQLFEIPSADGEHVDVDLVLADPDNPDAPAYSHYSYTIGTTANKNELIPIFYEDAQNRTVKTPARQGIILCSLT